MAKVAILQSGSTYTVGSRTFTRDVPTPVDNDLAEYLGSLDNFKIKELTKKDLEAIHGEDGGSKAPVNEANEKGLTAPVPNAQAGSHTADKANDEAIVKGPDPKKNAHTDAVNPPKK